LKTGWDVEELLDQLESLYLKRNHPEQWAAELPEVRIRLKAIGDEVGYRYGDAAAKGVGGSGIVLRVSDHQLDDSQCALKFPRPVPGKAELVKAMLAKEITYLIRLRHPSIVRIHSSIEAKMNDVGAVPAYVMDYLDGDDSAKYFATREVDETSFLQLLERLVQAIAYMHQFDLAHMDLKAENVLVTGDGLPVLSDLGTTKHVTVDSANTIVAVTYDHADPDLLRLLPKDPSDSDRAKGTLKRSQLKLEYDLHPLGLTILEWVNSLTAREPVPGAHLSPYVRKYLLLMVARLASKRLPEGLLHRIGLEQKTVDSLRYTDISSVLEDVGKLTGAYSITHLVPELDAFRPERIQILSGETTPFTRRVQGIVDHKLVRRLGSVRQLGLVNQVFPTAVHSRLEHCLGTFHNACRAFLSLFNDPLSPLFRQMMDASDAKALLLAALLHDAGQFPLAHDLEELVPAMFDHEALTLAILRGRRETKKRGARRIQLASMTDVLEPWDTSAERVVAILEAKHRSGSTLKDRILHSIFEGPLDADKLDYLLRDSERCGVPYGRGIDFERVVRSLTVVLDTRTSVDVAAVGVHEKAKAAAEFVAVVRATMFSQVYWHHSVRAAKAMLGRAVVALADQLGTDSAKGRAFQSRFERFVLELPGSLYPTAESDDAKQPGLIALGESREGEDEARPSMGSLDWRILAEGQTSLGETDAAVLLFLRAELLSEGVPGADLLDDLLLRRLYSRLFVLAHERDRDREDWDVIAEAWPVVSGTRRIRVLEHVEKWILTRLEERLSAGPPTAFLGNDALSLLRGRVNGRAPVMLIDIPGARPGGAVGLYYVLEEQRRMLRKDDRIVGDIQKSGLWNDFTTKMHQRTGKIRIYCYPRLSDAIAAGIDRAEFVGAFRDALAQV
jgi:serine/threonine protein kinase